MKRRDVALELPPQTEYSWVLMFWVFDFLGGGGECLYPLLLFLYFPSVGASRSLIPPHPFLLTYPPPPSTAQRTVQYDRREGALHFT